VLGPAPSPIAKLRDHYRWRLFFRGQKPSVMRGILKSAISRFDHLYPKPRIQLTIDVDPQDML